MDGSDDQDGSRRVGSMLVTLALYRSAIPAIPKLEVQGQPVELMAEGQQCLREICLCVGAAVDKGPRLIELGQGGIVAAQKQEYPHVQQPVAAGRVHTCALQADGNLVCFGMDLYAFPAWDASRQEIQFHRCIISTAILGWYNACYV